MGTSASGTTGQNSDDGDEFVRWETDPAGTVFRIHGVQGCGGSGPVFLGAPGGGAAVQGVLRVVNWGLVRVQPAYRNLRFVHLEVRRVVGKREEIVLELECTNMDEAHERAVGLAVQIKAGNFSPTTS